MKIDLYRRNVSLCRALWDRLTSKFLFLFQLLADHCWVQTNFYVATDEINKETWFGNAVVFEKYHCQIQLATCMHIRHAHYRQLSGQKGTRVFTVQYHQQQGHVYLGEQRSFLVFPLLHPHRAVRAHTCHVYHIMKQGHLTSPRSQVQVWKKIQRNFTPIRSKCTFDKVHSEFFLSIQHLSIGLLGRII